jgi:uncharacterized membrane protein
MKVVDLIKTFLHGLLPTLLLLWVIYFANTNYILALKLFICISVLSVVYVIGVGIRTIREGKSGS